jgi:hypothetical protein
MAVRIEKVICMMGYETEGQVASRQLMCAPLYTISLRC